MSSLRPLATIALLAAVGVFLYMKINETEPKLSAELEEWSTSELAVGGSDGLAVATPTDVTSSSPAPVGGDEAPPFAAPTAPAVAPAGDSAPAWTPGPVPGEAPAAGTPTAPAESSPMARSADTPAAVPAMPPLPGASGGGDPQAAAEAPKFDAAAAAPPKPTSMFSAARVAAQSAADRGDLGQALQILSDWYGDPSLTPAESKEVNDLLAQLAGSVIYEGPPAHRLEPPYIVQAGESLESVAAKYDVPWQLLAKINGLASAGPLPPGQELKVVKGPFSAVIDLSERRMTLMLDRRYAGQFPLEIEPTTSVEEGEWKVTQKLLTPAGGGTYGSPESEDRSLLLANLANPAGPTTVLRGSASADPMSTEPRGRVLRLKGSDVEDVYDILSEESRVTIRK